MLSEEAVTQYCSGLSTVSSGLLHRQFAVGHQRRHWFGVGNVILDNGRCHIYLFVVIDFVAAIDSGLRLKQFLLLSR